LPCATAEGPFRARWWLSSVGSTARRDGRRGWANFVRERPFGGLTGGNRACWGEGFAGVRTPGPHAEAPTMRTGGPHSGKASTPGSISLKVDPHPLPALVRGRKGEKGKLRPVPGRPFLTRRASRRTR